MPKEGQTGTLPDGTQVIYLGGQVRKMNPGGLAEMGQGYYESPQGRKFREGPKGGFAQIGGPTQAQVDEYAKGATGTNKALGALDALDQQARGITKGPFGWVTNPQQLAVAAQSAKDLQLRLKEKPYNLGVLNGSDYEILQKILNNPEDVKSWIFEKNMQPMLRNLASILGRDYRNDTASYRSLGGRSEALPNLFRSPRSQYTADEWGPQGSVPKLKSGGAPAASGGSNVIEYDAQGNRVRR